ncbi:hypothetical protein PRZ48_001984 [Zasmidium cellare]|uniref:AB hydrolase-1 domain-containing protein n=1 Tax=Zasmidium cellare TaxID=395010 RepID=A0ABR0F2R9_ZASCE|nr:hypothetical protein PRZ48_001984 [Zasmidium cellare]
MPGYGVHIPSIHDGLTLTCRLHYSSRLGDFANSAWDQQRGYQGAIVAHPYAPLGGSQEDHVVAETTKTLVQGGYIVMTFNFRGAGDSQGRASWTGKGEMDDYTSVFGFLVHYLDQLSVPEDPDALSPVISATDPKFDKNEPFAPQTRRRYPIHVLLAGYSFGGLIMARLPHVGKMIERFANAPEDSFEAKIREQARTLAESDQKVLDSKTIPNGYKMASGAFQSPERHRERDARIAVGSSDTNPRKSGDSRRSEEIVRNIISHVPHVRKHSGDRPRAKSEVTRPTTASSTNEAGPKVRAAYLMISPVLFPLTTFLVPPGLLFGKFHYDHDSLGLLSLTCPIYVVYGEHDNFTSSKRLDQWVEKLKHNNHQVVSEKIAGAGHFWNGKHVDTLQKRVQAWLKDGLTVAS